MGKKFISLLLSITILIGCFSMGLNSVVTQARGIGVGTGAESFNPVKFSVGKEVLTGTEVNTTLSVEVTDKNYSVKINSIKASMVFYDESGASGNLNVSYTAGTIVAGAEVFEVVGSLTNNVNSVVRYTIEYDIQDKSGNTIWKNLTGYTYALVSSKESQTGAVGTYYDKPGNLSDGCYFDSLDTLNSCYVQQAELMLYYTVRTQSFSNFHDARTRGVNVVSGNAPSTVDTMPDNNNAEREGQMNWPECNWGAKTDSGRWFSMTEPSSDYYNFTISFNSWNDDWENQSNITETTEMYYIRNADRVAAYNAANKIMKTQNTFADGFYVQKGLYTEESWNNFINAIDMAYQVSLSVPNANYGYKIACQNAQNAASAVDSAFAALQKAEHDFEKYKDVVRVEPTCTETGSETYVCICGEEKVIEVPAIGHDQGRWQLSKPATCTSEGLDELVCTRCNSVSESRVLSKIAHEYSTVITEPTCTERGYTTYTCVNCKDTYTKDYVDEKGHSWSHVVTSPTCIEQGYTTHTCIDCGYETVSLYVKPTGHSWKHVVTEPTCTTKGYTTHSCDNCGFERKDTYVDAKGHSSEEAVREEIIDATCTTEGSYDSVVYCAVCDAEISRDKITVDALGHADAEPVKENEVPATKDEDGSYDAVVYCSVCGEERSRVNVIVKAYGHYPAGKVQENVTEATCTTPGSYDAVVYCTCCTPAKELSRETVEVEALGHNPCDAVKENEVLATCVADGSYDLVVYCSVCEEKLSTETNKVASPGHEYDSVETPPTCTEAGFTTYTCIVCGDFYKEDYVEAPGHDYEGVVTPPSFDSEGFTTFTCTVCGDFYTGDFVDKLAGVAVSGKVTSFGNADDVATIALTRKGENEPAYVTTTASGKDVEYSFEGVSSGEYTMEVSMKNHVTRIYDVVVAEDAVTVEAKIHLIGDITGDGKVNTVDVARANAHAKGVGILESYEFACADITGDGKVNTVDVARANAHAKGVTSLW